MLSTFSIPGFGNKRRFDTLSEQEILALAISSEEEDGQIYAAYASKLRADYPASAAVFDDMAAEESEHRRWLIEAYKRRFGDFIVPIRREHVAGYYARSPVWLIENLGVERIRQEADEMERQAHSFYLQAAARATDADTRKLLGDLAIAEAGHEASLGTLVEEHLEGEPKAEEDPANAQSGGTPRATSRPACSPRTPTCSPRRRSTVP